MNRNIDWENTKLIYKVKDEKKRKIVEAAVINSVKNVNLNDGFYKFDSLTTKYVIDAANLGKTIKQLNGQITVQGDVTKLYIFLVSLLPFFLCVCVCVYIYTAVLLFLISNFYSVPEERTRRF